jgi:hypothetical protein
MAVSGLVVGVDPTLHTVSLVGLAPLPEHGVYYSDLPSSPCCRLPNAPPRRTLINSL